MMFLVRYPMVFIFLSLFISLECPVILITLINFYNFTRNKVLTAKHLRQGHRYHKLCKAFPKFYQQHFDLVSDVVWNASAKGINGNKRSEQ